MGTSEQDVGGRKGAQDEPETSSEWVHRKPGLVTGVICIYHDVLLSLVFKRTLWVSSGSTAVCPPSGSPQRPRQARDCPATGLGGVKAERGGKQVSA